MSFQNCTQFHVNTFHCSDKLSHLRIQPHTR